MAEESSSKPLFSRTKVPGLDMVTIHGASAIEVVLASGDTKRVSESGRTLSDLSPLLHWYFPMTRYYNESNKTFFMAFRDDEDETYAPCRAFLEGKYAQERDLSAYVQRAADVLCKPGATAGEGDEEVGAESVADGDEELAKVAVQAMWAYMVPEGHPEIPEEIIKAAGEQLDSPTKSFVPWKVVSAKMGVPKVYSYVENTLELLDEKDELPAEAAVDGAHGLFVMQRHGPKFLRAVARLGDDDSVEDMFGQLGLTQSSMRMCVRDGTLGGVLGDEEARAFKTLVLLDIGGASKEVGGLLYAFGAGPGERRCVAGIAVIKLATEVLEEVRRRRAEGDA